MKLYSRHFWLLGLVALALTGCGTITKAKYAPEVPIATQPLPPALPPQDGSLWTGRQSYGLVADARPVNVGDLVTISITETNKASEIANTATQGLRGQGGHQFAVWLELPHEGLYQ